MKPIARLIVAFLAFFPAYALIPIDFVHASSVECQCVLALRELQGIQIYGDAWTQKANIPSQYVEPGDVALFSYAETDHVALVLDVISKPGAAYISLVEYNYHHCQKSYRTVDLTDPSIRGFLRPSNSWQ